MHFKLIVAFVDDRWTEKVMEAARKAGLSVIDRPDVKRSRAVLLEKSR